MVGGKRRLKLPVCNTVRVFSGSLKRGGRRGGEEGGERERNYQYAQGRAWFQDQEERTVSGGGGARGGGVLTVVYDRTGEGKISVTTACSEGRGG